MDALNYHRFITKTCFLIGRFYGETDKIDPVIWSLVHEMRISIIFPVIILFVVKFGWKRNVLACVSIPILLFTTYIACLKLLKYDITTDMYDGSTIIYSLHYLSFFMIGAIIAKLKNSISGLYNRMNKITKIVLLVIGVLFYSYSFNNLAPIHHLVIDDWAISIGATIFIIFSFNSKTIKSVLLFKPIHFVGKVSYSLYLLHSLVLFTMVNTLYGKLPNNFILEISFVLSFIVSSITYYLVEKPALKLEKFITQEKHKKVLDQKILNNQASIL